MKFTFLYIHICIYNTHRGCHINTVLPIIQDCEYIAPWVGYTQDRFSAVNQGLDVGSSISCCSRCLQHEGSKVEKQSHEMVKHILRKRERGHININYEAFPEFGV